MEKEASFLLSGYIMSYIDKKNIIEWTDKKILLSENNELLFDLSLSYNDEAKIISILNKLYGKDTITGIDIYYFSLYRKLLNKNICDWKFVAKEMCKFYLNNLISINDTEFFFSRIYDYFELIRDGFPGNMDMPRELIDFLSKYDEDIQIFKELEFVVKEVKASDL